MQAVWCEFVSSDNQDGSEKDRTREFDELLSKHEMTPKLPYGAIHPLSKASQLVLMSV